MTCLFEITGRSALSEEKWGAVVLGDGISGEVPRKGEGEEIVVMMYYMRIIHFEKDHNRLYKIFKELIK